MVKASVAVHQVWLVLFGASALKLWQHGICIGVDSSGGIGVTAIPQHNLRSEVTRALPDLPELCLGCQSEQNKTVGKKLLSF